MGDNLQVAKVVGINVDRTKIILFVLMGALSAFAGLLLTIEHTTFWTTQGSGFLLIVMAAVFIGGTSIFGGQGIIVGTIFGSFIVGSIEAGIVATGIQGFCYRDSGFLYTLSCRPGPSCCHQFPYIYGKTRQACHPSQLVTI